MLYNLLWLYQSQIKLTLFFFVTIIFVKTEIDRLNIYQKLHQSKIILIKKEIYNNALIFIKKI